ncbi:MAG: biotin--[acetyl-CoA-carboxylase] ligase, partial [Candidatus Poseidoniia archaeon]|nr:biotin--[acetyl-CoA-carboxylase] ligase [Candidatus Poseidoniia archaeon]
MIHIVDRVSSTNTWLSSNSMGGNDCILALQQTGGKGRGDRVWESPPGGLYLSIISPSHSLLPLIAGISVIQTLVGLDNRLRLKWPNDIILDGKKVGGILCEDDGKHAV